MPYVITLLSAISSFALIYVAVHLKLSASLIYVISIAASVGSFVSFSTNISLFARERKVAHSGSNFAIATFLFLLICIPEVGFSEYLLYGLPLIIAIERREQIRVAIAVDPNDVIIRTSLIFACASLLGLLLALYAFEESSFAGAVWLVTIYSLTALQPIPQFERISISFSDRVKLALSELVPFASGILVLYFPLKLLNNIDFLHYRLSLSYMSLSSPILQILITRHLMRVENVTKSKRSNIVIYCMGGLAFTLLLCDLRVAALCSISMISAIIHSRNKFFFKVKIYAILSAVTGVTFVTSLLIINIFNPLSVGLVENILFIAITVHVVISEFCTKLMARKRSAPF